MTNFSLDTYRSAVLWFRADLSASARALAAGRSDDAAFYAVEARRWAALVIGFGCAPVRSSPVENSEPAWVAPVVKDGQGFCPVVEYAEVCSVAEYRRCAAAYGVLSRMSREPSLSDPVAYALFECALALGLLLRRVRRAHKAAGSFSRARV